MQYSLFESLASELTPIPLAGADVSYQSHWLSTTQALQLYERLANDIQWQQDIIKYQGRSVKIPRLQHWFGQPHCHYQYSGLRLQPSPFSPLLLALKERCEQACLAKFNCVLANWYRDGNDGVGLHADDEPELGREPIIASLSLGATRQFTFKHLLSKQRYDFDLASGSLLVMRGKTQQHYHHGLAKTAKPVGGRINLTFRYIQS
jgi:alkylated DNA repair dioxygenase AlkB